MEVTLIGGGMIAHDQILPSFYHLQRAGRIGGIPGKIAGIKAVAQATARQQPVDVSPIGWRDTRGLGSTGV